MAVQQYCAGFLFGSWAEIYADVEYYVIDGAGDGFSGSAFDEGGYIFDYLQQIEMNLRKEKVYGSSYTICHILSAYLSVPGRVYGNGERVRREEYGRIRTEYQQMHGFMEL